MNKNELKNLVATQVPADSRVTGSGLQNALIAMTDNLWCECSGEVEPPIKTPISFVFDDFPNKVVYAKGETLDLTGLTMRIQYSDNTWETGIVFLGNNRGITANPAHGSVLNTVGDSVSIQFSMAGISGDISMNITVEEEVDSRGIIAQGLTGTGNALTWILYTDGELDISGNGAMSNFSVFTNTAWMAHKNSITSVTIGDGVTRIGECAFYSCRFITSVFMHNSVTVIARSAFDYCVVLTTINLSENLTTIEERVFFGTNLDSIFIPASVVNISSMAFTACNVRNISVVNNNPNFSSEDNVLYNKNKTDLIYFGKRSGVFVVPGFVTSIGQGQYASFGYGAGITSLIIPSSVSIIDNHAFEGSEIKNIVTPEIAESLGNQLKDVTSVILPEGVVVIGIGAFRINNFTSVTIPSSVTTIGDMAFEVEELKSFINHATTPQDIIGSGSNFYVFTNNNESVRGMTLYVPDESIDAYMNAPVWQNFMRIVGIESGEDYDGIDFGDGGGEKNLIPAVDFQFEYSSEDVYKVGDTMNFDDFSFMVYFEDGHSESVRFGETTTSDHDTYMRYNVDSLFHSHYHNHHFGNEDVGFSNIEFQLINENDGGMELWLDYSFMVEGEGKTVVNFYVDYAPPTEYNVGDYFDGHFYLTLEFSDGSTEYLMPGESTWDGGDNYYSVEFSSSSDIHAGMTFGDEHVGHHSLGLYLYKNGERTEFYQYFDFEVSKPEISSISVSSWNQDHFNVGDHLEPSNYGIIIDVNFDNGDYEQFEFYNGNEYGIYADPEITDLWEPGHFQVRFYTDNGVECYWDYYVEGEEEV